MGAEYQMSPKCHVYDIVILAQPNTMGQIHTRSEI
jgi:hypothetical protein